MKKNMLLTSSITIILLILTGIASYFYFFVLSRPTAPQEIKFEENLSNKIGNKNEVDLFTFYIPNSDFSSLESQATSLNQDLSKEERGKELINKISNVLQKKGFIKEDLEAKNIFFHETDAFVNLNDISSLHENETKTLMILYGIANSIIDLGNTDRVKFLINNQSYDGVFAQYYLKYEN